MLSDRMNERVITAKAEGTTVLGLIGSALLVLIGAFAVVFIPTFGILGAIVAMTGVYIFIYVKQALNLEYEYTLTNGDIDVAKIMQKSRRKDVLSISADSITYMDYADSDRVKNDLEVKKGQVKVNYFTGKTEDGKDVAIYSSNGKDDLISILNFDEKCIAHMKDVLKVKCAIKQ